MVKPTLPYLDIVTEARDLAPDHPLACYQVSGEFAMIHAGAKAGVYELRRMAEESVQSMVRAGANIILSYFTPDFLDVSTCVVEWLKGRYDRDAADIVDNLPSPSSVFAVAR